MTALAAGLALVPIALSAGEPGSEIQAPMAMVIMFGLAQFYGAEHDRRAHRVRAIWSARASSIGRGEVTLNMCRHSGGTKGQAHEQST